MTKEAAEYWNEKKGERPITIEEWLSKAQPEIRAKPIINTLNNKDKPVSPMVMDELLRAPIWQISEARIHEAKEVQSPQKTRKWIREIMEGKGTDRSKYKTKDIVPVYIQGWETYKWAWVEYNRKDGSWKYGGMQKRRDKVNENVEGQKRIQWMFTDNLIEIKEEEKQDWNNAGRDDKEPDAGIWTVETLRRRLLIGVIKRKKINTEKARRGMLAACTWKEEAIRIEAEEEEEKQEGKGTKQTGTGEKREEDGEREIEKEDEGAAPETWEIRQGSKHRGNKTLEEMGFDKRAESSSRGERIRKREQYQKSSEVYKYPEGKDQRNPKIQKVREKKETEK